VCTIKEETNRLLFLSEKTDQEYKHAYDIYMSNWKFGMKISLMRYAILLTGE